MSRKALGGRGRLAAAVAVVSLAGAGLAVVVAGGSPSSAPDCGLERSDEATKSCYAESYLGLLRRASGTDAGVARITRVSRQRPGPARCHVIMHTVGQRWARNRGLGLRDLAGALPRSRDDGCASGFAHGLITAMAPQIDVTDPQAAVRRGCARIRVTYERLHCVHGFGHAFSRIWNQQVRKAVAMCSRLAGAAEAYNCAHGALMDYWIARAAEKRRPARRGPGSIGRVCALGSPSLVQVCWFRATWDLHLDTPGIHTSGGSRKLCTGLEGPARRGCTAAVALLRAQPSG